MKRKLLIASHGRLASGLQSSLELLTGRGQELTVIDAYVDDSDYTEQLEDFIRQVKDDEQALIFTDLLGGSVNQKVLTKIMESKKETIFLISNVNLALVLSLMYLKPEEALSNADIQLLISETQVQLVELSTNDDSADDFLA